MSDIKPLRDRGNVFGISEDKMNVDLATKKRGSFLEEVERGIFKKPERLKNIKAIDATQDFKNMDAYNLKKAPINFSEIQLNNMREERRMMKEKYNLKSRSDEIPKTEARLIGGTYVNNLQYKIHNEAGLVSSNLQKDKNISDDINKEDIEMEVGDNFLEQDINLEKQTVDRRINYFLQNKGHFNNRDNEDKNNKIRNYRKNLPVAIKEKVATVFPLAVGATVVIFFIGLTSFISFEIKNKNNIQVKGVRAVEYIKEAKFNLKNKDFELATTNLISAKKEFADAQKLVDKLGGHSLDIFEHIPFLSKISSGKNVIILGDNLTDAVVQLSKVSKLLAGVENPLNLESQNRTSLTNIFVEIKKSIKLSQNSLDKAEKASKKIKIDDLPGEYQEKIKFIKEFLPLVNSSLDEFDRSATIFLELFGYNSSKKYLIVFQNNQEMRATGGFIGSYGLLETSRGQIDRLKIEGIYNPDGQLKVDVVPPLPIQKISTGWSTHDANWWPDFPKSAEKISWFYEKTGGPTVDGVIAVTPVLLQKMLEITGPIDMSEYDQIVTSKNFIKIIQQEVEENYDKEVNMPKKILADLAPKLFAKFFDLNNSKQIASVINIILEAFKEKHIIINFRDNEMQKVVSEQGWSGEILNTDKDYLMVVNSNINGYKTDGVVKEQIYHKAEINENGEIIDTVTITRKHKGGNTDYEWWNKVNADYMRVYVPEGSKLISVSGQTRELNSSKLNYDRLGFLVDKDIDEEEKNIIIDQKSGTRIYNENNKTVFANWVYVSPQEQVTIVYKYLLPFRVNIEQTENNRYSLLIQKQSGSINSKISSIVEFPFKWKTIWLEPKNLKFDREKHRLFFSHKLDIDQFIGVVFK